MVLGIIFFFQQFSLQKLLSTAPLSFAKFDHVDLNVFLLYKNTIRIGHKFHYLDRFLPVQRYNTIDVQTTQISTDHHHCKRGYLLLSLYFHGFDQRINERYFLSLKYFIFQRQESITVKSTRHDPLPSSHIVCPRHLAQIHVIDM